MNTLDLILIVLFILSSVNGFRQGLIRALANLIGWFLALFFAIRWTDYVQPIMNLFTPDPILQKISAFVAIVMVIISLTWIVGYILQNVLKQLKLSWLNRLTGGTFGLSKSMIVVMILLHGTGPWLADTKTWKNSKIIELLFPYSAQSMELSKGFVQKTAKEITDYESNENNRDQDAIIEKSTSDKKSQVDNPFL